jgi:hypothetical protein
MSARIIRVLLVLVLLLGTVHLIGAAPQATKKKPTELEKELVKVCQEICEGYLKDIDRGRRAPDLSFCQWSRRWVKAEKAISEKPADLVAAYKAHWERMKIAEKHARTKYQSGRLTDTQFNMFRYYRIQAEIWFTKAQDKK